MIQEKLSKLNGVLLLGGDGDYLEFGSTIYEHVKAQNDQGNFYPLWGTCQGYEYMARYASDSGNPLLTIVTDE